MREKLKEIALRYEDLQAQLGDPAVYGDSERLKAVTRELKELPQLTAEAVRNGEVHLSGDVLHIPKCLRQELLSYISRAGILSGPLFVTRSGTPIRRTSVTAYIQRLAHDACVPVEKCTPRCLRKLYLTTRENIRSSLDLLMEQTYDRMLETEQMTIGWKDGA